MTLLCSMNHERDTDIAPSQATMHGNEPSRGAQQDAEIQAEEAELLRKKQGKTDSMPGKKFEHKPAREH
ncbi:hypothetical protein RRF57_012769 [Xylaria bambusicola]|uniref:Uncharacterized protein n=1 Tax=Xylaria bambusicola TaxID=326684 RepID=A0AAN7ZB23_9PEZI